jgi:NADH-quinone oxidoreductase subunit I
MLVTAQNAVQSWYRPERMTVVQYPEETIAPIEASRSFPFLVYDGEDPEAGMRCVACKICEKECPPQCIYIESDRDEKGKVMKRPKVFDIDLSVCMSCQICVEVCPFEAIKMDQEYALASRDRFGALLFGKDRLLKSNGHYRAIHPTEAAEVDARLAAKRAGKEAKGGGA